MYLKCRLCVFNFLVLILSCSIKLDAAQQANGFKVGEVSAHSATIWTRTTVREEALIQVGKFNYMPRKEATLSPLPWQAPGKAGEVRVIFQPKGDKAAKKQTRWLKVDDEKDFTRKVNLTELRSATEYVIEVHSREVGGDTTSAITKGTFTTAPEKDSIEPIHFTVTTCQGFHRRDTNEGHQIYDSMLKLKPKFLVHTGDVLYYDKPLPFAKNQALARYKWNRIYSLPKLRNFHQNVSCYYQKDDHDTLKNDAWPGQAYGELTFDQGLSIFKEQTPFPEDFPYRTQRWGKDLQIWLMEGRDFRTPNNLKDPQQRTIWGKEQLKWLEQSLEESDATVKLVISPTPIVGPDRTKGKSDNHANETYSLEGDTVRALLVKHNAVSICGDRHWQYSSFDPKTKLREFGCGPASPAHVGGYTMKQRRENHTYLKMSAGFLQVKVQRGAGKVELVFIHHATDGKVNHSETLEYEIK